MPAKQQQALALLSSLYCVQSTEKKVIKIQGNIIIDACSSPFIKRLFSLVIVEVIMISMRLIER